MINWFKTDESLPTAAVLAGHEATKLIYIRRGIREVRVWEGGSAAEFKRVALAWAMIFIPEAFRP